MLTLILKHLSRQHKELREYIKVQIAREVRDSEAVIRADLWKLEQKLEKLQTRTRDIPCHGTD